MAPRPSAENNPSASKCQQLLWLCILLGPGSRAAVSGRWWEWWRGRRVGLGTKWALQLTFFSYFEKTCLIRKCPVFSPSFSPSLVPCLPPTDGKGNFVGLPLPPPHLKWHALFVTVFPFWHCAYSAFNVVVPGKTLVAGKRWMRAVLASSGLPGLRDLVPSGPLCLSVVEKAV